MTQETKVVIGIGIATFAILIGGVFFFSGKTEKPQVVDSSRLVTTASYKTTSDAKVTIVEFADFQCPACGAVHPTIKRLLGEYKGKVRLVFRHFPLPQHGNAIIAAKAAEAAGDTGGRDKFWQMYDKLFEHQSDWSESNAARAIFISYAKEIGLDVPAFEKALDSNKYNGKITNDQIDGKALDVTGTPTFFIGNEKFTAIPTYENLKQVIYAELNK